MPCQRRRMLVARCSLPTVPTLSAPEKLGPVAVALPLGDAVIAAFAASTQPMTLARFAPGAEPLVREYPAVDYLRGAWWRCTSGARRSSCEC